MAASSLDASTDATSPAYRMRRLELDLGSVIAQGYTEKHPDVVRLQSEIDLLRKQVADQGSADSGAAGSMAEQNARSEQRRAELRAISATGDVERLRTVVAETEARLAATPAVAERLDGLNRQYEHLYRSYQDFSSRLQQAGSRRI